MNRVRAFFVQEADACLRVVRSELDAPTPDREELHRAIRRFRGNAQVARFGSLAEAALALEHRLRPGRGAEWDAALVGEVASGLETLEKGVERARAGRLEQDPRIEDTTEVQVADQGGDAGKAGGAGSEPDVTPIDQLEYTGSRALDRALELREPLEDAIVAQDPVGPIIEEVFDLIRLGRA